MSNQFRKYFIYAIGEILLVVIGILIALQVNNWNEKKMDKQQSVEFHQRLLVDLDMIIDFLDMVIQFSDQVEEGVSDAVVILEGGTMTDLEKETVDKALSNFFRLSRHLPELTSYDEMKSTGQLGLIYNADLRQKIADYLVFRDLVRTVYEDLNEKVNETAFIDPYVRFNRESNFNNASVEYDFKALASERTVINTLSRYAFHWKTKTAFSKNFKSQAEELKAAVEHELKRLES